MFKETMVNTGAQVAGKAISVGISLLTTGILTRKLGVSSYGNFILISSLFVFLDSLADFGTKTIGVREIAARETNENIGHVFNLRMVMAAAAFVVGLLLVWLLPGMAGIRVESSVAMVMIFLTSIAGFWEIIFQSRLRMDLKVVMDTVFPLAFLIWLLWWRGNISLMAVFVVYIAARAVSLAAGYFLVTKVSEIKLRRPEWKRIKELWEMTWPMGVFLMLFATYDRAVDSLIIQNFWGAERVAWYGLAYKIYGVLLQPAYFYVNSIFPMMSGKEENKRKLFLVSAGFLITTAVAMVIGVQVAAPMMVGILAGAAFEPAIGALRILIIAALFSYMGHLVGFTLIARGGQKEMLKIGVTALVFNLVLNLLLIPRFGILAAAWVTVATEGLDMLLMAYFLKKNLR